VLLGELQRRGREQFLLRDLHQAGALPVLLDACAYLRQLEHLPCHLRLGYPVPHGDDVQQQLQLCDGVVSDERFLQLYRDALVHSYPVSLDELRELELLRRLQ
jgi:hypothetical protein